MVKGYYGIGWYTLLVIYEQLSDHRDYMAEACLLALL